MTRTPEERLPFWTELLRLLGLPARPWRIAFLEEWGRNEFGSLWAQGIYGAKWNPLATTYPAGRTAPHELLDPPAPYWNDNGGNPVKQYRSLAAGASATHLTLTNGRYPAILASLGAQVITGREALLDAELRNVWGTTGFADRITGGWKPQIDPEFIHPFVDNFDGWGSEGRFGDVRPPRWSPTNPHRGVDISTPTGTRCYAPAFEQRVVSFFNNGSFGIGVCLDLIGTPYYLLYAHLSSAAVDIGQELPAGHFVGLTGATGDVTGPHIHLQCGQSNMFPATLSGHVDPLRFRRWDQQPPPPPPPVLTLEQRVAELERLQEQDKAQFARNNYVHQLRMEATRMANVVDVATLEKAIAAMRDATK